MEKRTRCRLRRYLETIRVWSEQQEEELQAECAVEVDAAVKEYLTIAPQPLESMFDYLYATLPTIYTAQRDMLKDMEKVAHG